MAHGLVRGRAGLDRIDANRIVVAILRLRSTGWCDRRHRRSSQVDSVHRSVDGGGGVRARIYDNRRTHVTVASSRTDVCPSAGDAIETPTGRAILPELVGSKEVASASALNGIELNFARAVGPALAGVLIATAGVGAAFVVNVVSFVGVIVVIVRWKRPVRTISTLPETVTGSTVAALRYVRHSPALRAVMARLPQSGRGRAS
jgi:hypothetical protein